MRACVCLLSGVVVSVCVLVQLSARGIYETGDNAHGVMCWEVRNTPLVLSCSAMIVPFASREEILRELKSAGVVVNVRVSRTQSARCPFRYR